MSVPELGSGQVRELSAGVVHLVIADDLLADRGMCGVYLAVCGALVPASDLPSSLCAEGCECDFYSLCCSRCVRRVVQYAEERAKSAEGEADPHDEPDDDDDSPDPESLGRFVGLCGHPVVINYRGHLGLCPCDTGTGAEVPGPVSAAPDGGAEPAP